MSKIDDYVALRTYLNQHTPKCSMSITRSPLPQQEMIFRDKNNDTSIGTVSANTLNDWIFSEDNTKVDVYLYNGTSFSVPTVSFNCNIGSYDNLLDIMFSDDIIINIDNNNTSLFSNVVVEECDTNGVVCTYDTRYDDERKTIVITNDNFLTGQICTDFIRVELNEVDDMGIRSMIDIPLEWND